MLQHLPLSSLQTYAHVLQSVWNLKASQRFLVQFHFTGINRGLTLDCSYCCPQGGVFCLCRSVMTAQHCYLNRHVRNKMIIITQWTYCSPCHLNDYKDANLNVLITHRSLYSTVTINFWIPWVRELNKLLPPLPRPRHSSYPSTQQPAITEEKGSAPSGVFPRLI